MKYDKWFLNSSYHFFLGFPHLPEDLLPEAFPELPPENPPHPPGSDGDDSAYAFLGFNIIIVPNAANPA